MESSGEVIQTQTNGSLCAAGSKMDVKGSFWDVDHKQLKKKRKRLMMSCVYVRMKRNEEFRSLKVEMKD